LKRIIFWVVLAAIVYALLGYHFIFFGGVTIRMLKKSRFTVDYTFYSVHGKQISTILAIDDLREDGIADLLVDMGRMSEAERDELMARYE
jgi:hypothetical protein